VVITGDITFFVCTIGLRFFVCTTERKKFKERKSLREKFDDEKKGLLRKKLMIRQKEACSPRR